MDNKEIIIDSTALVTAVAAAAGAAAGAVALARGETTGAPGITKGLARLGRAVGGSMLTGVALVGACSALIAVATFQGLRQIDL
jgi:hypothetical protein